ncbi:Serpin-ZX [Hibiscus syriacus]|uniref:Serpin-ZX n=1 Tax=Hibiscus syriacus TaxID=106335 RepID=A0A6A3BT36_HIBSY|nr:Serpin-ZX [Hibiscus syriacus]
MDLRQSIRNQTDVAFNLTKNVLQAEAKGSNLVFSPLSIHVVLSMIAAGSKASTLDQLLSFLKSESSDQLNSFSSELVSVVSADGSPAGGPRLSFANGVWLDKSLPLRSSFKQVVDNVYKAASNLVDFQNKAVQVAGEVNSWAEKETSGLIKEVLPPGSVDASTRFIFANALYFKGAWNEAFDASKTKDYDFQLVNGNSVKVKISVVSPCISSPDAKDGLPALVDKVSSGSGFLEHHLPSQPAEVGEFRIPRFKISFGLEASEVLKRLGLELPFSGKGGLSEMVDSPEGQNLYVSSIFHKSFIEVNEEGTEAAAATRLS